MDRQKLLGIIVKDLEELKFLSEEITENEEKSNLIIDLALSKARLLCQEIEVLKEISVPAVSQPEKEETAADDAPEEDGDEEEEETFSVAEPELEIINFEHPDFEEEVVNDDETDAEDGEEEEEADDDLTEEEEEEEESVESEIEEPVFEVAGEDENEEPEENEEEDEDDQEDLEEEDDDLEDDELEEPEMETEDNPSLEEEPKPEFREIALDDEDDLETIPVAPIASAQKAPVFREIPKPEEPTAEKAIIGETFQKERSLNDAIGENQSTESKIANGPISNLRTAIGLNDRFLFIREIFDNNAEKYNTIIENLDKLETIQQAVDYLKANLTLQKNETSMKFVELLKRRFTK